MDGDHQSSSILLNDRSHRGALRRRGRVDGRTGGMRRKETAAAAIQTDRRNGGRTLSGKIRRKYRTVRLVTDGSVSGWLIEGWDDEAASKVDQYLKSTRRYWLHVF